MSHESTESAAPPLGSVRPLSAQALQTAAAHWLHAQGVTSLALLGFAATFAVAGAFLLLIGHAGMGGGLGLIAVLVSELARVGQPLAPRDASRLARSVCPALDVLLAAAVFGGIATRQGPPGIALAFLALVLLAWLPVLRSTPGAVLIAETSGLWRRGERMGLLLLGVLLGREAPALVMIVAVCGLEAWLRVERLAAPFGMQPRESSRFVEQVVGEDGSFTPTARWLTIGVTLLAILLLPQSAYWRI